MTRSSTCRSWVTSTSPPGEPGQALLEPGDGVDVEVVGRLVEDEQVALGAVAERHQRPGQRHPLGLAAREPADVGVEQVAQAEPVEHGLALPAPADRGAHRPGGQHRDLVERDDAGAPPPADDARLGLDGAGQHAEQRRLAGAVDADDAQPVAAGDGDRQVGEQRLAGSAHRHAGRRRRGSRQRRYRPSGDPPALRRRAVEVATGVPGGTGSRHYRRPPMARGDGILSGPLDIDGPRKQQPTYPTVEGEVGLEVLHRATGVEGTIIGFEHGGVAIRDRNTRSRRLVRLDPGGFRVRGRSVTLVPPRPVSSARTARRTASGSMAVRNAGAGGTGQPHPGRGRPRRRAGREGVGRRPAGRGRGRRAPRRHGPPRRRGRATSAPGPGAASACCSTTSSTAPRRPGSPRPSRHPHVLVTGTPYVDVWQAVRPTAAGIDAWPEVPRGEPWKEGVIAAPRAADDARRVLAQPARPGAARTPTSTRRSSARSSSSSTSSPTRDG